jgi:hypothetical protein
MGTYLVVNSVSLKAWGGEKLMPRISLLRYCITAFTSSSTPRELFLTKERETYMPSVLSSRATTSILPMATLAVSRPGATTAMKS